ncbi:MAG: hypothetical protein LC768_08360 [Acidobacteria bacterium]|nr:hypothetical protein [Acidobacteriota bacterium]MCA1638331.1 hypothetical protein [Acidobacteriota bacterium]
MNKNTSEKTKTPTNTTNKQKKDFLDVLLETSRFPELRYSREFSEFILSQFVAEAAAKCLEIKEKYKTLGKPLTPGKAVEISFVEGVYIDTEEKNSEGNKESYLAKTEDGKLLHWINPNLSVKDGRQLLITGLATCLLTEYTDLYFRGESYNNLEELCENPPLLKAHMVAEALTAMLLSNESKAELIALQSVTKQGGADSNETKSAGMEETEEFLAFAIRLKNTFQQFSNQDFNGRKRVLEAIRREINNEQDEELKDCAIQFESILFGKHLKLVIASVREKYNLFGKITEKDFYRICEGENITIVNSLSQPEAKKIKVGCYFTSRDLEGKFFLNFDERLKGEEKLKGQFHLLGNHFLHRKELPFGKQVFDDSETDGKQKEAELFASLILNKTPKAKAVVNNRENTRGSGKSWRTS